MSYRPPQIPCGEAWDRIGSSAVESRLNTEILLKIQIFCDGNLLDVSKYLVTSSVSISATFDLIDKEGDINFSKRR